MKRLLLFGGVLGVCCALAWGADDKHDHPPAAATNAGFEKMKKLVGAWAMADAEGKPTEQVVSVIKLTAGGSAIHETIFPGEAHEMVSVYTADGPDVVMTHYCMLGNQPQMRAKASQPSDTLHFEFAGGTNLNPAKDKHMHSAVLTFVDDDRYEVDGVAWDEGKPCEEMCGKMILIRKK